jgi:hypothetical protein
MSDDGTGHDINITSILISEEDGKTLKDYIIANGSVSVLIDSDFNANNTNLEFQLFFHPMNHKVYELLQDIRSDVVNNKNFKFNPIYTFELTYETREMIDYLKAQGRCMCGERYCEDYDITEGRGNAILVEAIRQKCIYLKSFDGIKSRSIYFDYMQQFNEKCRLDNFSTHCSDNILKNIDYKLPAQVYECFILSFTYRGGYHKVEEIFDKCDRNLHLEESYYFLNSKIKKALPFFKINGNIYLSSWKKESVYKALCAGLENKFDYCYTLPDYTSFKPNEKNSFTHVFIIMAIILVLIINLVILYLWKRFIHNKKRRQANNSTTENKELVVKIEQSDSKF